MLTIPRHSTPRLISQLPSDSGVYTFPTDYLARILLNKDPDSLVSEVNQYKVDISASTMLLLPLVNNDVCALLVLYNPIAALEQDTEDNNFMLFLDSNEIPCVNKDLLSRRVRNWLNRILNTGNSYSTEYRFNEANYPLYAPQGEYQLIYLVLIFFEISLSL